MATTTTGIESRAIPRTAAAHRFTTAAVLALVLAATPAFAITAGDVLDRMDAKERAAYIDGALDMAWYTALSEKNPQKADCISAWFFPKGGNPEAVRELLGVLNRNKELQAAALINVVINRHCGAK